LTGRENIYLNGAILGMSRHEIRRKFDEIVAFAEVERFLDTPVKRYSSGMYVRLAFAVAAHLEPEILIVDEVLAVGDAAFQKKCLGKMEQAGSEGRTILFVSHNVSAVAKLCSRSIVLRNGEIVCDGTTSEALTSYTGSYLNKQYLVDGSFLFHDRTNTYGPELILQSMTLRDKHNAITTSVPMGGDLVMEFMVENFSQDHDAVLGIIIKNSANQWITCLNTAMVKPLVSSYRSFREIVTLELTNLRLTPGIYDIDVAVSRQRIGRLDYVENAAYFEVLEADVYGTGYVVTNYFGAYYCDGTWRINSK
jgi:lipopolysaccharide transport system ATP-binding protein